MEVAGEEVEDEVWHLAAQLEEEERADPPVSAASSVATVAVALCGKTHTGDSDVQGPHVGLACPSQLAGPQSTSCVTLPLCIIIKHCQACYSQVSFQQFVVDNSPRDFA